MKKEKTMWLPILGFEDIYHVSQFAQIKNIKTGRILKKKIQKGYERLSLNKKAVKHSFSVHRLVGIAFIPNPKNKPIINHKDKNKANNYYKNLEWCTNLENLRHAFKNRTKKKFTTKEINQMYVLSKKNTLKYIASCYKVPLNVVHYLLTYIHPKY